MAVPRLLSDRAGNIYAGAWCAGFVLTCIGAHFRHPRLKLAGYVLLAPFSIYVTVMFVGGTIAFIRWFWRNRRQR